MDTRQCQRMMARSARSRLTTLAAVAVLMILPSVGQGAIMPVVTENGKVSLSIDGAGTNGPSATIQVLKPAGATVRSAYMAAGSTGFSNYVIPNGGIQIDGVGVNWDSVTPSTIDSSNHFANVTALVKAKIDAAAPGLVSFTITETNTFDIDGELMAVIFDDPGQTTENSVILLFGAQNIAGDSFAIALAEPLDLSDPALVLDLSLGISYGFQPTDQISHIDVNGVRMTSAAGGQDDGAGENGALLTVGGLGDTNANPANPFAGPTTPSNPDDELYSLLPFVNDGDTGITVDTINPSNDDNIFFGALFLTVTGIVGEGAILAPATALNPPGAEHTVTATVQDDNGDPVVDRDVSFEVTSGPNAGAAGMDDTDGAGEASFTYASDGTVGVDEIQASFQDSQGASQTSNVVTKFWDLDCQVNEIPDTCDIDCAGFGGACEAFDACGTSPDADGNGVPDECNQDPVCDQASADPDTLWPPNHLLTPISVVEVSDPDGDPVVITPTGVTQDEAVTGTGTGSGNTSPDAELGALAVRAERSGSGKPPGKPQGKPGKGRPEDADGAPHGNGRVYHVSFTADDGQGGSCSGTVTVCVPHDQGPDGGCVDDGPLYDSIP